MRIRSKIKKLLWSDRDGIKIHTPLHLRSRIRRWHRRLVYVLSITEKKIIDYTYYANDAMIKHKKPPEPHGSQADIGDLVQIYNESGFKVGKIGIVTEIRKINSPLYVERARLLKITGYEIFVGDYLVRIISKAKING